MGKNFFRGLNAFLVLFLPLLIPISLFSFQTQPQNETCGECHSEIFKSFEMNVHGRLQSFEVKGIRGCESCHGSGKEHVESGDPEKILSFKKLYPDESSKICLRCHITGNLSEWNLSAHSSSEVGCNQCHSIHGKRSLVKAEPQLCLDCHKEIKAKIYYPSHHPLREGKIKCSDCHQHHGSLVKNLKTLERTNDLCFNCHADKQGPFIFEHAPVVENCGICHEPHGTVANNLLKQNEPFLCFQCHEVHKHAGREGLTYPYTIPATKETSSNPYGKAGWRVAFLTKCTQCHFRIHGTDNPSQTVTGGGKGLIR